MAPYIERFLNLAEKIVANPILMPHKADREWIVRKLRAEAEEIESAIEALKEMDAEATKVLKDSLEKIIGAIKVYEGN